jgi:pyrroline-5-carboxylate reductase
MKNNKVAFVGGGNITRAIVGGLINSGFPIGDLFISDPVAEARDALEARFPGVTLCADNNDVVTRAGCVVLAVKPQVLPDVCRDLRDKIQYEKPLIVSIAAGPRGTDIDHWLGGGLSVVRVMPNQPALLGRGVSGLHANTRTTAAEQAHAEKIIGSVGSVVIIDMESKMDAVTAVSGTGPAYFYLLIDMLAKTAVELGIPERDAMTLALKTASGAAALASAETESMDALIARVRSPGGTTAAAFDSLESADVRAIFSAAITAARDRATDLGDAAHHSQD